jgi:hypothetical protein
MVGLAKEVIYKHYKNGQLYRVLHSCQYQHEGEWHQAVCYQDINSLEIYVREENSFDICFSAQ